MILLGAILAGAALGITALLAMCFRVVVSTNEVHIVQSRNKTTSYGKELEAGNTYYKWPSWVPIIGVKTSRLPMSVFDVDLDGYAAYDKGRVPFVVDIMAFFRVANSNLAAQRVNTVEELNAQLVGILQGACRSILARSEIEEILEGRSTFGELFTKEVDHNLEQWGVQSVKQIELMDIRDAADSKVIQNIMSKKKSLIEMQSRVEVAANNRTAQVKEIEAQQDVEVRKQEALQQVGTRTAEKEQKVGIATQQAQQMIKEQEKLTAEKQMEVVKVTSVKQAEINREVQLVTADQDRKATVIKAEGALTAAELNAKAITVEGEARGSAETAILLAPVNTQITLAKEIGENQGYQTYLLGIKEIEKAQVVGVAQAEALKAADIKVIANTGAVTDGVKNVMDLFTSQGGTQIGAMLEGIAQTPVGGAVVKALKNGKGEKDTHAE